MLRPVRPPPRSPSRPVPAPAELAAIDVDGFVRRLDRNLTTIASESSLAALVPPDALAKLREDPRFADVDSLFRATLRGTLVATSFRALPDAARPHPAVQDRLWSS